MENKVDGKQFSYFNEIRELALTYLDHYKRMAETTLAFPKFP